MQYITWGTPANLPLNISTLSNDHGKANHPDLRNSL